MRAGMMAWFRRVDEDVVTKLLGGKRALRREGSVREGSHRDAGAGQPPPQPPPPQPS